MAFTLSFKRAFPVVATVKTLREARLLVTELNLQDFVVESEGKAAYCGEGGFVSAFNRDGSLCSLLEEADFE